MGSGREHDGDVDDETPSTAPADGEEGGGQKASRQVYCTGFRVATEAQIREFFSPAGGVVAMCNKAGKSKPKYSRETVLCTFKKDKALKKAIELNGTSFQDAVIRVGLNVEPVREAKRAEGSERIFVGNLPWDMTVEKVEKMFSECGTVVFVRFAFDEEKQFRGFCHVTFRGTTGDAVDKSMEFDGAEVGGRVLKVGRAEGKKKHTDSVTGKKLGKNRDEEKGGADGYKGMERVKEAGGKGGAGDTGGKGNSAGQEVGHKRGAADVAVAPATKKINTSKYFNERD